MNQLNARIQNAETRLEKKLLVLAELTSRLEPEGIQPILVGGTAVEFYTVGDYLSYDDLVTGQRGRVGQELESLGFQKEGRFWFHPGWDISIEIPGDLLAGDKERVIEIEIADGGKVYCISREDLLIDRLNAAVHWRSAEDKRWAATLVRIYRNELDWDYLQSRATENDVSDLLASIVQEAGRDA